MRKRAVVIGAVLIVGLGIGAVVSASSASDPPSPSPDVAAQVEALTAEQERVAHEMVEAPSHETRVQLALEFQGLADKKCELLDWDPAYC